MDRQRQTMKMAASANAHSLPISSFVALAPPRV
jgi:hypothetical protein